MTSTETGPKGAARPVVALLFGGRSSEHPISLHTAHNVLEAIDREVWDVVTIGIARSGEWFLCPEAELAALTESGGMSELPVGSTRVALSPTPGEGRFWVSDPESEQRQVLDVDVVFPLLHGPYGEDGTLQGMLELAGVPYVGCGVAASAVGMDKHFMKIALAAAGLAVGPYEVVTDRQWRTEQQDARRRCLDLGLPLFVKPARAGSSFGITRVDRAEDLDAAVEEARRFDPKVVVEAGIDGREIECAVLGGHGTDPVRVSLPGEIRVVGDRGLYDFEAKYLAADAVVLDCPARLTEGEIARIRELAARAFEAIDGEGLSRVDFFYTPDGEFVVNEVNTMPGFTVSSMYPRVWEATGIGYTELITELVTLASERSTGLR